MPHTHKVFAAAMGEERNCAVGVIVDPLKSNAISIYGHGCTSVKTVAAA